MQERIHEAVRDVLAPLIAADGGRIELVSVDEDTIVVRLLAACAGCPGVPYTTQHVIEPFLRSVAGPQVRVIVERAPTLPG